jgi:regulator of protease activity HflC (stomatin/prohibitin superfamily)
LATPQLSINENFTTNRDYRANLESFMIARFKREMGKINITQVAAHRGDVALAVQKALTTDTLDLFGIIIVDFQINDIRYTDQYRRGGDRQGESRTVCTGTSAGRSRHAAPEDFRPRAKPTRSACKRAARRTATLAWPPRRSKARACAVAEARRWRPSQALRSNTSRSPSPASAQRQLRGRLAWRRVAPMSSWITPGSVMAWPASATMRKSASGQARDKSQAFLTGVTTS